MSFYVYILECADGSLYTGHTEDIDARLAAHRDGAFKGYTSSRRPLRLIFREGFATRDEAFAAERRIKGWSREKKLALARGDWAEIQRLARIRAACQIPTQTRRWRRCYADMAPGDNAYDATH